jgi:hypothetical protein
MSRKPRSPAGATAQAAIDYFAANPSITSMASMELADAIGASRANFPKQLSLAVNDGRLIAERVGNTMVYSPAEPAAPANGKLEIVTYADGDIGVSGMVTTDEGALFTKDQLKQLFTHVTTPHLVLGAAD